MDVIKKFFRELFLGYMVGILAVTLIIIALNEMFRVFVELGFVQFAGIASILIFIVGIIGYWQEWEIFEKISKFIESLRKIINV